jgi:hypothetical protein
MSVTLLGRVWGNCDRSVPRVKFHTETLFRILSISNNNLHVNRQETKKSVLSINRWNIGCHQSLAWTFTSSLNMWHKKWAAKGTVRITTKLFATTPYKTAVVHSLQSRDLVARLNLWKRKMWYHTFFHYLHEGKTCEYQTDHYAINQAQLPSDRTELDTDCILHCTLHIHPGSTSNHQEGWKEMEEVKGFVITHIVQRRTTGYKAGELQI